MCQRDLTGQYCISGAQTSDDEMFNITHCPVMIWSVRLSYNIPSVNVLPRASTTSLSAPASSPFPRTA